MKEVLKILNFRCHIFIFHISYFYYTIIRFVICSVIFEKEYILPFNSQILTNFSSHYNLA